MAKTGFGLIIAGVALLILGLFFLPFIIESEAEAREAAQTADEGAEPGNETLDSQDHRLLGLTSTIYLAAVVIGALVLVGAGIYVLATRR